jgi:hypothetical protein
MRRFWLLWETEMVECSFELNSQPMSVLTVNAMRFSAFSGLGEHVNRLGKLIEGLRAVVVK